MDKTTEIISMLQHMRPAFSECEEEFIKKYILPLGGLMKDNYGNLVKKIGDNPEVMWSCHTDTVHKNDGMQGIELTGQYAVLNDPKSNCMGADDAVGVWLMMELIRADKEGLYVFHRCEERGGMGSDYITKHHEHLFKEIKCVIALDRMGTRDLITHQGWERCCSDEFGASLAEALNMKYELCDGGVFTDSANYTDIVGECTNLSVGYENEHSKMERSDLAFLHNLRNSLLDLDYSKLVYKREPGEIDTLNNPYNRYIDYGYEGYKTQAGKEMYDLCWEYPDVAAQMLNDYGIRIEEMYEEIYKSTGEYPSQAFELVEEKEALDYEQQIPLEETI